MAKDHPKRRGIALVIIGFTMVAACAESEPEVVLPDRNPVAERIGFELGISDMTDAEYECVQGIITDDSIEREPGALLDAALSIDKFDAYLLAPFQSCKGITPGAAVTVQLPAWEVDCPGQNKRVVYNVTGTAEGGTYTIATPSGTSQGEASLPLRNQSGSNGLQLCVPPGEFVYISFQNSGPSGSVTCQISVDDEVISSNTSSGAYVIASCDGSA